MSTLSCSHSVIKSFAEFFILTNRSSFLQFSPQINFCTRTGRFIPQRMSGTGSTAKWMIHRLWVTANKILEIRRVPWILSWICSSSLSEASENIDSSDELKSSELKSLKIIFAIFSFLFELIQMCEIERISGFFLFLYAKDACSKSNSHSL